MNENGIYPAPAGYHPTPVTRPAGARLRAAPHRVFEGAP